MIRRPPRSTQSRSSAASDVYKRQEEQVRADRTDVRVDGPLGHHRAAAGGVQTLKATEDARDVLTGIEGVEGLLVREPVGQLSCGVDVREVSRHNVLHSSMRWPSADEPTNGHATR